MSRPTSACHALEVEQLWRYHEFFSMDATSKTRSPTIVNEFPIRVLEAAAYLGVSPQTVSLGRAKADSPSPRDAQNIRFLRSDLEPFRATFKQEVELARPNKHDGSI
jgi:hypothetical protein